MNSFLTMLCKMYAVWQWHCCVLHCVTSHWHPSLCNNSLGLRRLHWRPAVRVEVICNKKQSGNIPPPQPASQTEAAGLVQLGLDPQIRPRLWGEATLDTSHSADWGTLVTTDHTLQNHREFLSDVWILYFCDAETGSGARASLNLRQNWCHQTAVLIFPGVWPTDTN